MAQETAARQGSYALHMDQRQSLTLSGVTGVDSFDEAQVELITLGGALTVRGEGLNMERLDLDRGEVAVTGRVDAIEYTDDHPVKGGLLARLWR